MPSPAGVPIVSFACEIIPLAKRGAVTAAARASFRMSLEPSVGPRGPA